MADALLEIATKNWAARYEANGVFPSDFRSIVTSISTWDGWCAAWCKSAAGYEELGDAALEDGNFLTAGEQLARAAVYYHFAKYLFVKDMEQLRAAHGRAVACHNRALPHLNPPAERVLVPYEGTQLAGVLRRPVGIVRPAVVLLIPGLDSAKEEMDSYSRHFLDRQMATIVVDGPGQGEAEYDLPIRHDYERVVGAIINWLEIRDDIDPVRVGIWGVSLGGYYAPRAAAFDSRIRACVAIGGPYDMGANWDHKPLLPREIFRVRSHTADDAAARARARLLTLEGIAERITCPLFVVGGSQDQVCPPRDQIRLAGEARGPVELLMLEGGDHVCHNLAYHYRLKTADWMACRLGVVPSRGL